MRALVIAVQKIKIIATAIKIIELAMDLDGGRHLPLDFHSLLAAPSPKACAGGDCVLAGER